MKNGKNDPVKILLKLLKKITALKLYFFITKEIDKEILNAFDFAEQAPFPDQSEAYEGCIDQFNSLKYDFINL